MSCCGYELINRPLNYQHLRLGLMKLKTYTRCALMLISVLLLDGCSIAPDKPITMKTLPECGSLPNCVNSQSGMGVHAIEPLMATVEQWQKLILWITQQEDWEITIDDDYFVQAVVKTPVMRFRDDVQLLFIPDLQLIHVRSSSRLGYSDLGTNARRVESLRDQLAP